MKKTKVNLKLRKGDRVRVLTGKDVGKEGNITRVLPDSNRVIVDGINVAKKHQRQTRATMQAGIIDKDMPINAANVAILCDKCGPTRIGYRFDDDDKKVRVCKKCGADL
ncbi:MAG TPA: 50S ribosomal protein L24 [Candidatus Binatia bacterium]|nr:50S ribosomal protein L24 [Candidatus Binatia bacterium]